MTEAVGKLAGKKIFVIGDEQDTRPYLGKLKAQGAEISLSKVALNGDLQREQAYRINEEISRLPLPPEILIISHSTEAENFTNDSVIKALLIFNRRRGIHTLVVENSNDTVNGDRTIVRGANGFDGSMIVKWDEFPKIVAEMIHQREKILAEKPQGHGGASLG